MTARTSLSHPLHIAEIGAPGSMGLIGVTFCPGKKQPDAMTGPWQRDLSLDLDRITSWAATTVITLLEPYELAELDVLLLGLDIEARGMRWLHLPIRDVSIPDHRFETGWAIHRIPLRDQIRLGERVLIHCKGGRGRAGLVAALLLRELGMPASEAITAVRRVRPGAIETPDQERYVRGVHWLSAD